MSPVLSQLAQVIGTLGGAGLLSLLLVRRQAAQMRAQSALLTSQGRLAESQSTVAESEEQRALVRDATQDAMLSRAEAREARAYAARQEYRLQLLADRVQYLEGVIRAAGILVDPFTMPAPEQWTPPSPPRRMT